MELTHAMMVGPWSSNYKTVLCRQWEEAGWCSYGHRCTFAHGEGELKRWVVSTEGEQ